mgnify:CR=1 FL=1
MSIPVEHREQVVKYFELVETISNLMKTEMFKNIFDLNDSDFDYKKSVNFFEILANRMKLGKKEIFSFFEMAQRIIKINKDNKDFLLCFITNSVLSHLVFIIVHLYCNGNFELLS